MAVRVPRLRKAVHEQDQRTLSCDRAVDTNAVDVVDLMVRKGRFAGHRSSLSCGRAAHFRTGVAAGRVAVRFAGMAQTNDYVPSARGWVRDQVEAYERSGGKEANTLRETGLPVIIVTTRGAKTGAVRKMALMKVEHAGEYALVASMGGAPKNPVWYHNLRAHPDDVFIQDGPAPFPVDLREVTGDEKATWWDRAVAAFPPYADYQAKTDRQIPVFVATRRR